jgi:hypothetical protein
MEALMAERLNVTVTFKTVDAKDGTDFASGSLTWAGVPYEQFVAMEQSVNTLMN